MKAMEKLLLVLMMMAVANPVLAADDGIEGPKAGPVEDSITFEGRFVRLIFPGNAHRHERRLMPLILHLHGSSSFPGLVERALDTFGYRALPGEYDVIVAAPMGTLHPAPELGFFFWNATGACCGFESVYGPQVNDAGFLLRLVDKMIANYPVDPKRVYIFGFLNGGFMAHRMACDHADRFAAVVSLAGAMFKDPERCTPSAPISVLEVHSRADDVVLFDGGFDPEVPPSPETEYPGAIETIEQWGHINGCKGELRFGNRPVFDMAENRGLPGVEGKETTINRFTGCPHGVKVELWSMEGVPHVPLFDFVVGPNGIKTLAEKTWKFLRKHVRDE
jgi:polyhydroxybutyrate depolymerase